MAAEAQVVVEHKLVHLNDLLEAGVNRRDVLVQVVLCQSVLVVSTFFLHVDLAQINEEFFFIVFIKAVTDFAILLVVIDPVTLAEVSVALFDFLHVVGNLGDQRCLRLEFLRSQEGHFGGDRHCLSG